MLEMMNDSTWKMSEDVAEMTKSMTVSGTKPSPFKFSQQEWGWLKALVEKLEDKLTQQRCHFEHHVHEVEADSCKKQDALKTHLQIQELTIKKGRQAEDSGSRGAAKTLQHVKTGKF